LQPAGGKRRVKKRDELLCSIYRTIDGSSTAGRKEGRKEERKVNEEANKLLGVVLRRRSLSRDKWGKTRGRPQESHETDRIGLLRGEDGRRRYRQHKGIKKKELRLSKGNRFVFFFFIFTPGTTKTMTHYDAAASSSLDAEAGPRHSLCVFMYLPIRYSPLVVGAYLGGFWGEEKPGRQVTWVGWLFVCARAGGCRC
jgi:hypothetical protein